MNRINPFLVKRWIYGIPAPFWLKNLNIIEKMIQEQRLQSVPSESLMTEALYTPMVGEQEKAIPRIRQRPFPGGIRIPHLHFKGDVYLLDEEQWKKFSGNIIKDFQTKLAKVKTVNFEQVMEISEAIDSLT